VSTRDWSSYCMCVWLTHMNRTRLFRGKKGSKPMRSWHMALPPLPQFVCWRKTWIPHGAQSVEEGKNPLPLNFDRQKGEARGSRWQLAVLVFFPPSFCLFLFCILQTAMIEEGKNSSPLHFFFPPLFLSSSLFHYPNMPLGSIKKS